MRHGGERVDILGLSPNSNGSRSIRWRQHFLLVLSAAAKEAGKPHALHDDGGSDE